MPRIICTVDEATDAALRSLAEERGGVPISTVVRSAIKEYLAKNGKEVKLDITWGGKRQSADEGD